jgi:hypothetical protein
VRWLDAKGRLGGLLSLVDLAVLSLLAAILLPMSYFVYSAFGLTELAITDVEPTRMIVGENLRIKIRGSGFPQDCRVKLSTVDLGPPVLVTASSLEADIPTDLSPGWHHPIISTRRRSSVSVFPILATWKPEILSVTPQEFGVAEETLLEIKGKYFMADIQAFLGEVPLHNVEHVSESLLRVKILPGEVPPGPHELRLTNTFYTEGSVRGWPITVQGSQRVYLYVVMRLDRVSSKKERLLQEFAAGEVASPQWDMVDMVHLLKKKPGTVGVGMKGMWEYNGEGFRFLFKGQPVEPGSKLTFHIQQEPFQGEVLAKPVVRDSRYLGKLQ